jgi:hypothetical protein
MGEGSVSYFKKELEHAYTDKQEAIVFLAKIIPTKDKEQIRISIEKDLEFERKQHMFLGMNVRNALRAGGFSYFQEVMDLIWFRWLKEAVCLTEDKIVLSDTPKERVEKFQASIQKPPTCPELKLEEVERIKKQIEARHKIRLPEVDFQYSDNIVDAFCSHSVAPPELRDPSTLIDYPLLHEKVTKFYQQWNTNLKLKGLSDPEIERITPWKFTIFLPRRYSNYPAGLYGAVWHELGHVAASTLHVKDDILQESIAIAHCLKGLLLEAKEERVTLEKAIFQIEHYVAGYAMNPFSFLSPHKQALEAIQAFNPNLRFRKRDVNELIVELDKSIDHALNVDKTNKSRSDKPLLFAMLLVIAVVLIISVILSLLQR